jgi:hypothetical protein
MFFGEFSAISFNMREQEKRTKRERMYSLLCPKSDVANLKCSYLLLRVFPAAVVLFPDHKKTENDINSV